MNRLMKSCLLILLTAVVAVGMPFTPGAESAEVAVGPFPGQKAPDFVLMELSGRTVRLSDYEGKYVFLNFWATWCPYCLQEMPYLDEINQEVVEAGKNIVFLTIAKGEDYDTVKRFMERESYSFPVLLDEKTTVSQRYYVTGIPQSVIIDPDGIVVRRHPGLMTEAQMRQIVDSID